MGEEIMNRTKTFIGIYATVLLLIWLWPNLIHEPIHWLSLQLQGYTGTISFDWGYPPKPTTTATPMPNNLTSALIYLVSPSIVSFLIIGFVWATRRKSWASIITHIGLPMYLIFDLVINILTSYKPTSDFRFLMAFPKWVTLSLLGTVILLGVLLLADNFQDFRQHKTNGSDTQ